MPIGCGDVAVFPGDIVVGDDDCVIVIPQGIAGEIANEAVEMTAYEDFVVERVKDGLQSSGSIPVRETSTPKPSRRGAHNRVARHFAAKWNHLASQKCA